MDFFAGTCLMSCVGTFDLCFMMFIYNIYPSQNKSDINSYKKMACPPALFFHTNCVHISETKFYMLCIDVFKLGSSASFVLLVFLVFTKPQVLNLRLDRSWTDSLSAKKAYWYHFRIKRQFRLAVTVSVFSSFRKSPLATQMSSWIHTWVTHFWSFDVE